MRVTKGSGGEWYGMDIRGVVWNGHREGEWCGMNIRGVDIRRVVWNGHKGSGVAWT